MMTVNSLCTWILFVHHADSLAKDIPRNGVISKVSGRPLKMDEK
jgi:hypothetical protein